MPCAGKTCPFQSPENRTPTGQPQRSQFCLWYLCDQRQSDSPRLLLLLLLLLPTKTSLEPIICYTCSAISVLLFLKFFSQAETRGDEGLSSSVIALVEDDRPGKRGVAESRGAIPETFRTPEAAAQVLHLPPRVRQRWPFRQPWRLCFTAAFFYSHHSRSVFSWLIHSFPSLRTLIWRVHAFAFSVGPSSIDLQEEKEGWFWRAEQECYGDEAGRIGGWWWGDDEEEDETGQSWSRSREGSTMPPEDPRVEVKLLMVLQIKLEASENGPLVLVDLEKAFNWNLSRP